MKLKQRIKFSVPAMLLIFALTALSACTPTEQYRGDRLDGEPHGFGIWQHAGGAYYAGEFSDGAYEGRGTWIHPDGIRYSGQWLAGDYHGRGTLIMLSGARYDGDWKMGQKDGAGIFRQADGTVYIGFWKNDSAHGFGTQEKPDGYSYSGDWLHGKKSGEGTAHYSDGSIYHGQWLDNQRHGQGTLIFADGAVYEGGWAGNEHHGKGLFTEADGTITEGYWTRGRLQEVPAQSVIIEPGRVTLVAGGATTTLVAEITPDDASNTNISWSTSNASVAAVTDGVVKPLSPGSTTITATTEDGAHQATCTVTVSELAVAVTGITIDRNNITLRVGETATLIATVSPTGATNKTLTWTSDNTAIAAAYHETSQRGGVRAYSEGEAWITVTTVDGRHTARCRVTVLPEFDPDNRTLVPRLVGNSVDSAKIAIAETELELGQILQEFHASAPTGQVISQSPATGREVSKGTEVRLVVSKGPPEEPDEDTLTPPQGGGEEDEEEEEEETDENQEG